MDMELELLHSKCDTQASLLSDLQHQIDRDDLESERALGSSVAQINRSLRDLEDLQASLQDDLRQMKSYLNDDRLALSQQKQKLNELEGNVGILHKAMSGLSQLADEASPATDGGSEYSVQAGDNLEKIARRHATSVRRLKDLNDLTSDVIRVGQKLRLR
jgi:archaellum component FlaC